MEFVERNNSDQSKVYERNIMNVSMEGLISLWTSVIMGISGNGK